MNLELLPFTVAEIHHRELSGLIPRLALAKNLENFISTSLHEINLNKSLDKEIDRYLGWGGLPGLFFIRSKKLRDQKMKDQLETILDRDLRLVYPTTLSFTQLVDYVEQLSANEGKKLNLAQLRTVTGIAESTQKKILYSLEAVFMIRRLPIQSGVKGFVIYFEDQAEALYLSPQKDLLTQLEGLIYRHLRAVFSYRIGQQCHFFHYSTRGGARVPVCLEYKDNILGFVPILDEELTASHKAMARSFLRTFNNSKIVFLRRKARPQALDSRICLLPMSAIL